MFKSYRYEYSLYPYFEKGSKRSHKRIRRNHRHKLKQLLQKS